MIDIIILSTKECSNIDSRIKFPIFWASGF